MAINALQVAWLVRLAKKGVFKPGSSIIEFGPQDLLCSRRSLELLARFNPSWQKIDQVFDGPRPRAVKPDAFYELFGITRYKSVDGGDPRSDWLRDLNEPFKIAERFDVATNMGTFEHVFNIGTAFRSLHDALKPGGIALHVLPAFADIDHGFFNIHPTTYLDLARANDYVIEDLCYVDRWDIRVRVFEANLHEDYDFDRLPVTIEHMVNPHALKELVSAIFVENYNHSDTATHSAGFPGRCFDYCLVALRKKTDQPFQFPMQGLYLNSAAVGESSQPGTLPAPSHPRKPPVPDRLVAFARRHLPPGVKDVLRRVRARLSG
jgi:SAM-dependent methyltransferase